VQRSTIDFTARFVNGLQCLLQPILGNEFLAHISRRLHVRDTANLLPAYVTASSFLITVAFPSAFWALFILKAVIEDATLYPGSGFSTIVVGAFSSALFLRIHFRDAGAFIAILLAAYAVWYLALTIAISTSSSGYDIDGIPESERHRWYSPFGLNALTTFITYLSIAPTFFVLGAVVDGSSSAVVMQAHEKVKQMRVS